MHRRFVKGESIFQEGDAGDCAYIIEKGVVGIYIRSEGQRKLLSQLSNGELFGEMSLIDAHTRSASAIATTDCDLIVISRRYFDDKIGHTDPLMALVLKVLLLRYREMRSRLDKVLHATDVDEEILVDDNLALSHDEYATSVAQQVKIESELGNALSLNQFELHFQPIVSLNRGAMGCEALIRWRHPEKGLIPPLQFIGLAEQSGLIVPMGFWVSEEACRAYARIQAVVGTELEFISINLSSRQLDPNDLVFGIQKIYETYRVNPSTIHYEITESALMVDPNACARVLSSLRSMGARIAIDDFGTGYSSFSHLHRLPIDIMKIDRSFISVMRDSPKNYQIVNSLCGLARSLGMEVVAEGIEKQEEHLLLQQMGADRAQGYYYSKPLPEAEFCRILAANRQLH
jgi:EAL domain-containing protein (putative c-di-GMP-specific phosphodiesterase class I)